MKQRYKVCGKTVQVADKGLNCARNIYAAVKEANDGYIFSKSIHGRGLSEQEKVNFYDLINFMRDFRVVDMGNGKFINISRDQSLNEKIKNITGLSNLDALYLSENKIENFFSNCMFPGA